MKRPRAAVNGRGHDRKPDKEAPMSTKRSEHQGREAIEPAYPSSPEPPPDTPGEYLVSVRRAHWTPEHPTSRRVFHSYTKAAAYRERIEAGERRADAGPNDQVFVTIHWRPCRPWREVP